MGSPQTALNRPDQYVVKKCSVRISPKNEIRLTEPADLGPFTIKWNSQDLNARTLQSLVGMLRDNRIKPEETQLLGEYLYDVIFDNKIGRYLHEQLTRNSNWFLRVELIFEDWNSELIDLPWEYLYRRSENGGGYWMVRDERIALVRRPRVENCRLLRFKPNEQQKRLKVLLFACSPHGLPKLEFTNFIESMRELNENDQLELIVVKTECTDSPAMTFKQNGKAEATYERFKNALEQKPHVVHFLGHGEHADGGRIAFATEGYEPDWKTGVELRELLKLQKYQSVRLTFLQACETASGSPGPDSVSMYRALSSVANELVQTGIPAIVAMQSRIKSGAGNDFAATFYKAVVQLRQPIYRAIQVARLESADSASVPVLYLVQDPDGENEPALLFTEPDPAPPIMPGVTPPERFPAPQVVSPAVTCPWCYEKRQPTTVGKTLSDCTVCGSPLRCATPGCGKDFVTTIGENQARYFCPSCKKFSYRFVPPLKEDSFISPARTKKQEK